MPIVIRLTAIELQRIWDEHIRPQYPTGPCLTNAEISFYLIDQEPPIETIRGERDVELHTYSCNDCEEKLFDLLRGFSPLLEKAFQSKDEGKKEGVRQRILSNLNHPQN